jgi:AcrR family transcriptional regulator
MPRPKSDIDKRILHAARRRFLAEGVDGASLRAIAKDARTSIGMVYYYFPTKDDLFMAVVEEIYVSLLADLATALRHDAPVAARLERLSLRVAAMTKTELDVMRLVAREVLSSQSRFESLMARFKRGHIPLVLETIAEGMSSGAIDSRHQPVVVAMATIALTIVPQLMRRYGGLKLPFSVIPSAEDLAPSLVDILFGGIAPRKSAPAASKTKSHP